MQLTYLSLYYTTATKSVLLQVATPVVVALGARVYLGERLSRRQWIGVWLSIAGVAAHHHPRAAREPPAGRAPARRLDQHRLDGVLELLYRVRQAGLAEYSPVLATTAAYVLGTVVLIPLAVVTAPLFPAPRLGRAWRWVVIVYQAILGAVAHVWWYRAVDVVGPSLASVFMNLQTVGRPRAGRAAPRRESAPGRCLAASRGSPGSSWPTSYLTESGIASCAPVATGVAPIVHLRARAHRRRSRGLAT